MGQDKEGARAVGRQYKSPPIIEAICEFQFDPASPWDVTIPGLVYDQLREDFPQKRQRKIVNQDTSDTAEGPRTNITMIDRAQFYNESETALIQVNPHFLSVNHLKPYPSWAVFLPLIEKGLDTYRQVATPSAIRRVGLRYINRIELPGGKIELEDYFEFGPCLGANVPQDYVDCIVGVTIPFKDPGGLLRVQLTTQTSTPETIPMVLDLDHFRIDPKGMAPDAVIDWVDRAHDNVETLFEGCITDRTRELFEEVR